MQQNQQVQYDIFGFMIRDVSELRVYKHSLELSLHKLLRVSQKGDQIKNLKGI